MPETAQMEWTRDRVQRFWDYESQFPQRYFTYTRAGSLMRRVRPHLRGVRRAIDFGCGRGYLTEKLLALGIDVAAADYSPDSVAVVAQRFADRENFLGAFEVADLEKREEKFGAIFVVEVIEHLTDDALAELFARVQHIAEPGALVVLTTPNREKLEKAQVFCPACDHAFHRWGHLRTWSDETLSEYVRGHGWEVAATIVTDFPKVIPGRPWKSLVNRIKAMLPLEKPHLAVICRLPG
jgi:2-polyprenyl-3-methyl-5-hydroxy-6-metoxy-1,4-benzoquinol methylase